MVIAEPRIAYDGKPGNRTIRGINWRLAGSYRYRLPPKFNWQALNEGALEAKFRDAKCFVFDTVQRPFVLVFPPHGAKVNPFIHADTITSNAQNIAILIGRWLIAGPEEGTGLPKPSEQNSQTSSVYSQSHLGGLFPKPSPVITTSSQLREQPAFPLNQQSTVDFAEFSPDNVEIVPETCEGASSPENLDSLQAPSRIEEMAFSKSLMPQPKLCGKRLSDSQETSDGGKGTEKKKRKKGMLTSNLKVFLYRHIQTIVASNQDITDAHLLLELANTPVVVNTLAEKGITVGQPIRGSVRSFRLRCLRESIPQGLILA